MKKLTLLFLLTFLHLPVFASPQTVTLDVPSMNCAMCPVTVRKALEKVDGVYGAEASFDTKQAVVMFDDETTSVDALVAATTNAGYPSTQVTEGE